MIKNIFTIAVLITLQANAQILSIGNLKKAIRDDEKYHVWVYFTDKIRSLQKANISEKALKRRSKVEINVNFSQYDLNPSSEYVTKIINTGAKIRQQSRWLNAISIECNEQQLVEISYMPFVKEVKPIIQYRRQILKEEPILTKLQKKTHLTEIDYGNAQSQIEQINVHRAHEDGYFGQGVTVLMLDTGYNLDHPVFDSINVVAEWDVINNDSITKNQDTQDVSGQHNHGTGALSALGGFAPGTLVGPAFKADFLLAKTEILDQEVQLEEDNFVRALEWGEARGADVMSASLGYTNWYTWQDMDGNTAVTTKAVDIATSLGMLCVTSAGNENLNTWGHITAPADANSVIAVGAVDSNGSIANFSSRGPTFDGRIKPEVCARGVQTACASGNGVSYIKSNGTSFATPLVAGSAAILLSAHPTLSPLTLRNALLKTASQSNSPDNDYGYGIIDVWAAIKVDSNVVTVPDEFKLYQNYPNPFNSITSITYDIKQSKQVKVIVYDILGCKVKILTDEFESPGNKTIHWDGTDQFNKIVPTGIYFYSLILGGEISTKKMLFIK